MTEKQLNLLKQNPELWNIYTNKEDYFVTTSKYRGQSQAEIMEPRVSEHLFSQGYRVSYPLGKRFAICLTHDVDDIYPPLTHRALASIHSLKRLDLEEFKSFSLFGVRQKEASPYVNFRQIMDLERKYNAKSSFYFITAARDPVRFRYDIEDIGSELSYILQSGWEVGLHGGYYSYDDLQAIKGEKERLERTLRREIYGFRNHYLRFKAPDTWSYLQKCGFTYDSTYGYTNRLGFRNGMCHPFRPFNLYTKEAMDIYELPLGIMDGTIFDLTSSSDKAWEIIRKLIDTVANLQGVLTVLWHNNVFSCPFRVKWKELYIKLLEYGREKDAWMTSGEEIWRWWHANGY